MDPLNIFLSSRSEFINSLYTGSLPLTQFEAGLSLTLTHSDLPQTLSFLEVLYSIYTSPTYEALKPSIALKFFKETSNFLSDPTSTQISICEIFCRFTNRLSFPASQVPFIEDLSKAFSLALSQLMSLYSTKDLFPVLLKRGLKNKDLLVGFEKCVDEELVAAVEEYSKIHYLADVSEFCVVFGKVMNVLGQKSEGSVKDTVEFVAEKLVEYLGHHKNEDISGVGMVFQMHRTRFSEEYVSRIEGFCKQDILFKLINKSEKEESREGGEQDKVAGGSPGKGSGIKIASKPYDDDDAPCVEEPKTKFFENFEFRNHDWKMGKGQMGSKIEMKKKSDEVSGSNKRYKKKEEEKGIQTENSVENTESSQDRVRSIELEREKELKISIIKALQVQEDVYNEQNLINSGDFSRDLRKLNNSANFNKVLQTSVMNLIEESDKRKKYEFWRAISEVLKHLLEPHQHEAILNSLKMGNNSRQNRNGKYRNK